MHSKKYCVERVKKMRTSARNRQKNVAVTLVRKIQSSSEAVFAAWTEPRLIAQWLAPGADSVTAVTADLRPGGQYRIDGLHGDGSAYSITGTYIEIIENKRVSITWTYDGPVSALRGATSLVIADLRRRSSDVTELTLSHEKLADREAAELYRINWSRCLEKLEPTSRLHLPIDQQEADNPSREFFTDEHRRLQDRNGTRKLADRLQALTVKHELNVVDAVFIARQNMFFLATTDADGQPSCSYKGGARGFVNIIDNKTLAFPDFDGNGMLISVGNISENGRVGLLFVDFEKQARLRVNGRAQIFTENDKLFSRYPGARSIVRIAIDAVFPNCPRYIHKMALVEESPFVPDGKHPVPRTDWKYLAAFSDVVSEDEAGVETDLDKALSRD
ncbi:SRPBCC domain-containing protein [Filomicrobium insigne]|nr:SRPBCC domain-containing protein [Filomicrobium insigne]